MHNATNTTNTTAGCNMPCPQNLVLPAREFQIDVMHGTSSADLSAPRRGENVPGLERYHETLRLKTMAIPPPLLIVF
ncbi:hypothetical protein E2P81_ATG07448 [Venturia nashicola]|uniref:Uncharacterized protein n=1 Tax=Venturia nashicola TaxID=86259 RepID=A0A4Z1P1T8_9PEZI|nr:hypothetical protein E6O75_ATG07603 [Venturia nashicola]TLD31958.1 hypothetical protein E2P81_ATG07448 [Venturia nashicola]